MKKSIQSIFTLGICIFFKIQLWSQCTGIDANAGPDMFTCDPSNMMMLQGDIQGNYTSFQWTPTLGLSDPNVLDPMVTHKTPGRYTYTLTATGMGNVNLITNGNFESGNSGFSSEYVFGTPGGPFGPNNYGVGLNPPSYNGGFSPCGDHTSGGGMMMIVDGSTTPGRRIWCQTVPTVVGNEYLFELYVQSVYPVAPCQLNVTFNGTNFASGSGGAVCDWIKIEGCFKATSGSTQICISEVSGVGFGNDFAIDDIAMFEKCSDKDEVTVEVVDLKAKITVPFQPKCGSDPFDLYATGSSFGPNVTYEWSTVGGKILSTSGNQAKVRGSGIYKLKVRYKNGFVECEAEAEYEFQAPDEMNGNIVASGIINCRPDTVSLSVLMSSGSGSYRYLWAPAGNILSGQNSESVKVLLAGKYTLTVTDEFSDCNLILDYELIADTLKPTVDIIGDSLLNCKFQNLTLSSTLFDTSQYNLIWTEPDLFQIKDKASITTSKPGLYLLNVIDKSNFCSDTAWINLKQDTMKPVMDLGPDLSIDCVNDSLRIVVFESDSAFNRSFYWSIAGNNLPIEKTSNPKWLTTSGKVILNLVNEDNGCSTRDSINVTDLRKLPTVDGGLDQIINCKKAVTVITALTNPMDTLFYNWNTNNGRILSGQNTPDITVDKGGWYYIKVINPVNQCENLDSVLVTEDFNKPLADAGPDLLFRCSDTIVTIDGSKSSAGMQMNYFWQTTGGAIVSGQNTPLIRVNSSGLYTLIVLNSDNGCADTSSMNLNPDLNLPIVNISTPDTLNCIKSNIQLSAAARSQSGNMLVLNWTGPSGAQITNPTGLMTGIDKPGIYILKAVDPSNGCEASNSVIVLLDTLKPTVNAGPDLIWNCSTTQLKTNASATGRNLNYQWSSNNGLIGGSGTTLVIDLLKAGDYTLKVTDLANGCESSDGITVVLDTLKPTILIPVPDTLTCKNVQVNILSSGSSSGATFTYTWSTVDGNILGPPDMNSIIVDRKGTYRLNIKDNSNTCEISRDVLILENRTLPQFQLSIPQNLTCTRRSVSIDATNIAPANIALLQWFTNNGNIIGPRNNPNCVVGQAGWYYLQITDPSNGCIRVDSVVVVENINRPSELILDIIQPFCLGDPSEIQISSVTGGERPLNYWVDGQLINGNSLNGLSSGRHQLRVVDANGCELFYDFDIDTPSVVSLNITPEVKLDVGQNYVLKPIFGTRSDSIAWISWSPADFLSCTDCPEPEIINIQNDLEYVLSYANLNGCITSARVKITVIKRGFWVPNVFSPNGDVVNDWFYPVVAPDSYQQIRRMQIFDRWGALVFSREGFLPNDPASGWDGSFKGDRVNPGVYTWVLEMVWKNGETEKFYGEMTLLR